MFQFVGNAARTLLGAIFTGAKEQPEESYQTTCDEITEEDTTPQITARERCLGVNVACHKVSCRYHLLLDVTKDGGIKLLHRQTRKGAPKVLNETARQSVADKFVDEAVATIDLMDETCALNIAEKGPQKLETIGAVFGVTREGARLWVDQAVDALRLETRRIRELK